MFSKANLQALDEGGYRYIVAAKLKTFKKEKKEEILSEENYKPAVIGNDFTWIADLEHDGKRLITSYKSKRAINDAQERQKILDKINKAIGEFGSTKKLISNSGVKKYTSSENGKSYIDAEKIEQDALWDGMHGVITNDQTITPHEAIAKYARLWVIEEQFRINKHNLQMRPIFHWTKQRIEAHLAVCYMSFAVLKTIEYKVALTQKISVTNIVELLISVQASILRHTKTVCVLLFLAILAGIVHVMFSKLISCHFIDKTLLLLAPVNNSIKIASVVILVHSAITVLINFVNSSMVAIYRSLTFSGFFSIPFVGFFSNISYLIPLLNIALNNLTKSLALYRPLLLLISLNVF